MLKTQHLFWKYLLLAALMAMPVFGHLNTLPIRIWDESRLAINAYEMLRNGNYLVTHYKGEPDMWSTKPPLMIWLQVLSMKALGVNELAIRLPSALAAFFTCLALLLFSQRYLKDFWFGFIAVFILITSPGYVSIHGIRTGDYDALLTLFTTLSGLFFFRWSERPQARWLYLSALALALAVLTKSIAGILFLPAMLTWLLLRRKLTFLLKSRHFYGSLALFVLLTASYYLLREMANPGYLAAVRENELGGRYLNVVEDHRGDFWYYLRNFWDFRMNYWILLVPAGLFTGLYAKEKRLMHLAQFSGLMALFFLLIISAGQTKLKWYDLPLYPFMALLAAIFVHYWFRYFGQLDWAQQTLRKNVMPFLFLLLLGFSPYMHIFQKTYLPRETTAENENLYALSNFLRGALRGEHKLNGQHLLYTDYKAHLLFYLNLLHERGVEIDFKAPKDLKAGDIVSATQNHDKKYVEEHYDYKLLHQKGALKTYKIYGVKE